MFSDSNNSEGIFGLLGNYLKNIALLENTNFTENEKLDPFLIISSVVKNIAKIESKYSTYVNSSSYGHAILFHSPFDL